MTKLDPVALRHLIGAEWVDGLGEPLLSTSPSTPDLVVAAGTAATAAQVDAAVAAAAAAADDWRGTPHHERGAILRRAGRWLLERAGDLGAELTREEGKTLTEGIGEVKRAAQILDFYGSEADRVAGELYSSPRPGETIQVTRHPVGVVAVITPFNFPIAIPAWKIAPALSYGNTVVWKPARVVPLLAQRLAEALQAAGLPAGVLQLVAGPGQLGQRIVEHPSISAVTFTGSTGVGRSLIATCGRLGKPIQAEMGGKNAAVVLADANIDVAVTDVVTGAFRAAGQRCTATSRVIVEQACAEDFLTALVTRVDALQVGDPLKAATDVGPVVSETARDDIAQVVHNATDAERLTQAGDVPPELDPGYYIRPAVFELTTTEHSLWTDEIFGPVLTVIRAKDADHAFALANDSEFGLSASVFTNDLTLTARAIEEIKVGVLHINSESGGADPHVPFGGSKGSSFGPKEQGRAAREFFTQSRTVYLRGGQ